MAYTEWGNPLFDLTTSEILKENKKANEELKAKRETKKGQKLANLPPEMSQDPNLHSTKGATVLNEFISSLLDQRNTEEKVGKKKLLA